METDVGRQGRNVAKLSTLIYSEDCSDDPGLYSEGLLYEVLGNLDEIIEVGWRVKR